MSVRQYRGVAEEDPHSHLQTFLDMCVGFAQQRVSHEALRLFLFHFSINDRANAWLTLLHAGSISTWAQLAEKFLEKYFSPTTNAKYRKDIVAFEQKEDEALSSS